MSSSASAIAGMRATRRFRTREERRRIVEETLSAGVSVSTVARSHGVNANLVFHWRKLYHAGLLDQPGTDATNDVQLLPVVVHDESAAHEQARSAQEETPPPSVTSLAVSSAVAVHIEFPGRAYVSVVGSADPAVIRAVLESLRG